MKISFISSLITGAVLSLAPIASAVPTLINYQGRLSDANGDPVTGTKNFSLTIYDAATAGNVLYTENIGAVTLDGKGIYQFQFGDAGTSNRSVTERVGVTDGTEDTYRFTLTQSSVVANSISVTDGTYTWDQLNGSSDDTKFDAFYSASTQKLTVLYVDAAPTAGATITTTYRYETGGISGALSGVGEQWLEIGVDGVNQTTRQRVLAVPFAHFSEKSKVAMFAEEAGSAPVAEKKAEQAQELAELAVVSAEMAKAGISKNSTSGSWAEFFNSATGVYNSVTLNDFYFSGSPWCVEVVNYISKTTFGNNETFPAKDIFVNAPLRYIKLATSSNSTSQWGPGATIQGTIYYVDGTSEPFLETHSYGYYSEGESKVSYIKPSKIEIDVEKITLSMSLLALTRVNSSIWINSTRTIESDISTGFIQDGYEYKFVLSFETIEKSSIVKVGFIDSALNFYSMPEGEWTDLPVLASEISKVKLLITPAKSTSNILFTKPWGVVILKRSK